MALWGATTEAPWAALWARYDELLKAQQDEQLASLDDWYLASFPAILRAREPQPHMTQPELAQLMQWKLKKGKWRPQLMKFVTNLSDEDVQQASTEALEQLKGGELRAATEALCTLKGVGPATASAVLAAYDGSVPFMADEALEAVAGVIGPRKYTLAHFLNFAEQLQAKAKWLNKQQQDKDAAAGEWTAQRVQLCLYAEAHDGSESKGKKKQASPGAKRKREKTTTPPAEKKSKAKLDESKANEGAPLRRSQRTRRRPSE